MSGSLKFFAWGVAIGAIAQLFAYINVYSNVQLLQGASRVADFGVKVGFLGAFIGAVVSIGCFILGVQEVSGALQG